MSEARAKGRYLFGRLSILLYQHYVCSYLRPVSGRSDGCLALVSGRSTLSIAGHISHAREIIPSDNLKLRVEHNKAEIIHML